MRLTYDPKQNIAYIRFREATEQVETLTISDELSIDLAPDGSIYGIELLNANDQLRRADGGRLVFAPEGAAERDLDLAS
jgi:uncharacterized protein YuzE